MIFSDGKHTCTRAYTQRHWGKEKKMEKERDRKTDRQTGTEIVLLTGDRFSAD